MLQIVLFGQPHLQLCHMLFQLRMFEFNIHVGEGCQIVNQ